MTFVLRFAIIFGMSKLSISSKYQVVIPKEARKIVGITKASKEIFVKSVKPGQITFSTSPPKEHSELMEFSGSLATTKHATRRLRKLRDTEWG